MAATPEQQLEALAACGRPWAEQRAQMALLMKRQLDSGELSLDEYQELVKDLLRTDTLDREADSVETRALLVSALTVVAKLA
jgi:polyhydroxyalkanoate synthesis regulator phasin